MEGEKLFVTQRQLHKWRIMGLVEVGKITLKEAGEKIGVSYRQAKRLWKAVKETGAKGLIHGNVGRPPPNRISDRLKQQVLVLSRQRYERLNDVHFTEMLAEREDIRLSRETVRGWRREAGIGPKYPPCCLMAAMDDGTGKLLAARFFPFEGSSGYLWLLKTLVKRYGIPLVIYHDRHGALHRNDSQWTLQEQLAGRQDPTQVGLALEGLGIRSIAALSPQAKGRIERLFGTLQDRLGGELELEGIQSLEAANRFLKTFLLRFNRRFAVPPRDSEQAWRKVSPGLDLDRIISFRYRSVVGNDNSVRIGGLLIDLPPGPHGRSYAKAEVEVRQLLDGSWRVYYQDQVIAKHPSTELRDPVRALKHNRRIQGASSEQWVYLASAPLPQAPQAGP